MATFKIYQINLTSEEIDVVNSSMTPSKDVPKYKAYLDCQLGNYKSGIDGDFYEHVSDIEAEYFEEVFSIGNVGPEEKITRHAPMHSVSIGDILEEENGTRHVVSSFGFKVITK